MNVCGVVLIDLDDPSYDRDGHFAGRPAPVPAGVRVRVSIGDRRWLSLADCERIASAVWAAASVEVVGTDSRGIADLVTYLRDRRREQVA